MVIAHSTPAPALEVRAFFELLFAGVPPELYTAVSGFTSHYKERVPPDFTQAFRVSDLDGLVTCVERMRDVPHMRLYFRTSYLASPPKGRKRGTEEDTVGTNLLWADLDIRERGLLDRDVINELEHAPFPPTYIVSSSWSPHAPGEGLQVYWKLNAFCRDLEEIKSRNRWIGERFSHLCADSTHDLARVMRVPTTYSHKYPGEIRSAHVVSAHSERVYDLSNFQTAQPKQRALPHLHIVRDDLPADFLEGVKKRNHRLYDRILTEESAKPFAQMRKNDPKRVDRSLNDHYVACTLLEYGYTPSQIRLVLTHPTWFSGERYRTVGSDDYLNRTIEEAVARVDAQGEPKQYFNERFFVAMRMAEAIAKRDHHFLLVNGDIYHYVDGVYRDGGERFIEQEVAIRLGERWTSHYASETVKWIETNTPIYDAFYEMPERKPATDLWVNTKSGMVNIASGDVRPHSPKDHSITQLPLWYEPAARCPAVERFVSELLPGDAIPAWWEFIGYFLLPDVRFRKALFLIGHPNTGKSTLTMLVQRMLGTRNLSGFTLQDICDDKFTAGGLPGKIGNIFADLSTDEIKRPGNFKDHVAGDSLSIERKFHDKTPMFFPTAKHLYSANNFPPLAKADEAWISRWLVMRLSRQFVFTQDASDPDRANTQLIDELATPQNLSGMFNLALAGANRLLAQQCFTEGPSMKAAQDEYRFALDAIYAWFTMRTKEDADAYIPESLAYTDFCLWCSNSNRARGTSNKTFFSHVKALMRQLGLSQGKRTVDGRADVRVYVGRRIIERPQPVRSTLSLLSERGKL